MIITGFLADVKSAFGDHPVAISKPAVARSAINIEPLTTTIHILFGNRERKDIDQLFVLNTLCKRIVRSEASGNYRMRHRLSRGGAIHKEIAGLEWFMDLGFGPHIRVAPSHKNQAAKRQT